MYCKLNGLPIGYTVRLSGRRDLLHGWKPSAMALLRLLALLVLLSCLAAWAAAAADAPLQPSFPNHARVDGPGGPGGVGEAGAAAEAAARANPAGPVDTEIPFSWTQFVVAREGLINSRIIGGFDPGLQTVQIDPVALDPRNYSILNFDGGSGLIQVEVPVGKGGIVENLLYRVSARGIQNPEIYSLVYDFRAQNSRIRSTPFLTQSPGDIIRPGQLVRYTWTLTGRGEKRPKVEAEFSGRTGRAKGIASSLITEVLAAKFQPVVLGHYLMLVTPRDVRGEPPRGSTSNGRAFRCAFGSENLPPYTDGFAADTFTPAVGQVVTMQPVAIDPETAQATYDNQTYDFGDGVILAGVSGRTTHAYALPGIYRARCALADEQGLAATAVDDIIVGGTRVEKLAFKFKKNIPPEEAGSGEPQQDSLAVVFKDINARSGDRIVFVYNRNRFGRSSPSDSADDTDIVLGPGGGFSGATRLAKGFNVKGGGTSLSIAVSRANFDRTGDPRFGRADFKGIFKNQRIAVCVIPADGGTPRVQVYTGNMQIKLKGGNANRLSFVPEESINGSATDKEPDPQKQEIP